MATRRKHTIGAIGQPSGSRVVVHHSMVETAAIRAPRARRDRHEHGTCHGQTAVYHLLTQTCGEPRNNVVFDSAQTQSCACPCTCREIILLFRHPPALSRVAARANCGLCPFIVYHFAYWRQETEQPRELQEWKSVTTWYLDFTSVSHVSINLACAGRTTATV